jgi:cytidylate kinase
MEGRDIGTVVFPDGDLKIFLSAEPVVRAQRRERERGEDVAEGVAMRDALDSRTNPFVPAPDAHVLETTALSRQAVLEEAIRLTEAAGWVPEASGEAS